MSDEQVWNRMEDEPLLWYRRFERFRLMEPVRSIAAVYREEQEENEEKRGKTRNKTRFEADGTWYEIAKLWQWEERAAAWDEHLDEQTEKQIAAERKRVLRSEYALMHKRVELLNRKVKQLVDITDNEKHVWLADVKAVGTGEFAERVDLVQFNSDAFKELREYLDDLSAEMGERVKITKQEHSGSLEVFQGARDALVSDLEILPDVGQSQEQNTGTGPDSA